MQKWLRYERTGRTGFGQLTGDTVAVYAGDMFRDPQPTGQMLPLAGLKLLTPAVPGKMLAIWNNFHALAAKLGLATPREPLFFVKTANSFLAAGEIIRMPPSFDGKVVYEGELGIVIGRRCRAVSVADAPQ